MLETIFSWLLSAVGEGLQLFVNFFFGNGNDGGLLNFTLGDLYQNFPYFGTAYAILQACGLGLVLAIAAVNLFKVFLGSLSKAQDTPTQILVRAALATVLIYLGGYLLSAVVGIAKVPYDIFVGSDAITHHFDIPDSLLTDLSAAVGVGAAGLLVSLVLIIAIAWNLIKLLLECVERYLMVGVLVYTSPLIYPFLSSAATATVFQRWVGMFCGECALMSLSVLFTKLSISALSSTSGGNSVIAKLIMCLTMCKIAQRVDSYMQQLGIGVPTTGEGILGNAMAVGYALKHAFGGAAQKASKGDALSGNNSTFGNLFRGKRAYNDAFAQGNSPADSRAARKAARDYAKTPAGDWGMNQFTPRNANAVATAKRSQESAAAWQEKVQRQSGPVGENGGGRTGQQDFQDNAKKMGMSAQQFARMNLETNGAGCALIGPDGDNKANFELSPEAKNAGLMTSFPFGDDKDGMLVGPDSAVAAHIQDNFDKTELTDFAPDTEFHDVNPASLSPENLENMKAQQEDSTNAYQSTLANTLAHGSPVVAQEVLFNDRKNISGNDTLAQAALSNTFGENLRVGDQSGTAAASRLSNIRAETQPLYTDEAGNQWGGGRVVSGLCAVPGSSGRTYEDGTEVPKFKRLEIMDETAYKQMSSIQQAQMQQIPSKNGEIFYARAMDVTRLRAASKIGLALFRKAADFRISRTPDLSRADLSHRILLQVRGMSLIRTILCRIPAEEQKVPVLTRLLPAVERRTLMSVVPKTQVVPQAVSVVLTRLPPAVEKPTLTNLPPEMRVLLRAEATVNLGPSHKTPSSISLPAIRLHSVSKSSTTSRPVRRLPVRRRHLLLRNLPRAAKAGSGMTAPAMAEEAPSRRNRARARSLLA